MNGINKSRKFSVPFEIFDTSYMFSIFPHDEVQLKRYLDFGNFVLQFCITCSVHGAKPNFSGSSTTTKNPQISKYWW